MAEPTKEELQLQAQVDKLQHQVNQLKRTLEKYADCRHANQGCSCTIEARAALWERR